MEKWPPEFQKQEWLDSNLEEDCLLIRTFLNKTSTIQHNQRIEDSNQINLILNTISRHMSTLNEPCHLSSRLNHFILNVNHILPK